MSLAREPLSKNKNFAEMARKWSYLAEVGTACIV